MEDYKAAYNILMDYWNSIPEEKRYEVDALLKKALNSYNDPPKDCIKNALQRLRDNYGYGIPVKDERWKKVIKPQYLDEFKASLLKKTKDKK